MGSVLFLVLAMLIVIAALTVVLHPNPVKSALALIMTLFLLAVIFVLLEAHMIAALQIIVYAGAIMVLFLFVIMLLNLRQDLDTSMAHTARRLFGWLLGVTLLALGWALVRRPWALGPSGSESPEAVAELGNTQILAKRLFTDYLFPFELTSLILLVAIVGAIVLATRRGRREGIEEAP